MILPAYLERRLGLSPRTFIYHHLNAEEVFDETLIGELVHQRRERVVRTVQKKKGRSTTVRGSAVQVRCRVGREKQREKKNQHAGANKISVSTTQLDCLRWSGEYVGENKTHKQLEITNAARSFTNGRIA